MTRSLGRGMTPFTGLRLRQGFRNSLQSLTAWAPGRSCADVFDGHLNQHPAELLFWPFVLCDAMLYYATTVYCNGSTMLDHTYTEYYTVRYCTIAILDSTILYYAEGFLYHTVLLLYSALLYCTEPSYTHGLATSSSPNTSLKCTCL